MTPQSAYDAAMNATETQFSNDIYGRLEIDVWFCILQKGVGKLPFDSQQHPMGQRRTAVDINIQDLGGANYSRSFVAEIGTDGWLKVTLPSLRDLGVTDLAALNGAWVHAVMEPYSKYTGADGIEKNRTAPKVLAIYKTAAECEAAAQAAPVQSDLFAPPTAAPSANGGAANDAERAVALSFLPAIVKTAVRGNAVDAAALEAALRSNPILAKHFNMASPEVAQAMAAALAESPF